MMENMPVIHQYARHLILSIRFPGEDDHSDINYGDLFWHVLSLFSHVTDLSLCDNTIGEDWAIAVLMLPQLFPSLRSLQLGGGLFYRDQFFTFISSFQKLARLDLNTIWLIDGPDLALSEAVLPDIIPKLPELSYLRILRCRQYTLDRLLQGLTTMPCRGIRELVCLFPGDNEVSLNMTPMLQAISIQRLTMDLNIPSETSEEIIHQG